MIKEECGSCAYFAHEQERCVSQIPADYAHRESQTYFPGPNSLADCSKRGLVRGVQTGPLGSRGDKGNNRRRFPGERGELARGHLISPGRRGSGESAARGGCLRAAA